MKVSKVKLAAIGLLICTVAVFIPTAVAYSTAPEPKPVVVRNISNVDDVFPAYSVATASEDKVAYLDAKRVLAEQARVAEAKRVAAAKKEAARKARIAQAKAKAAKKAKASRRSASYSGPTGKKYSPSGGVKRWEPLVRQYFKSDIGTKRALAVMQGESGGNPNARGPGGVGLMQINPCHAERFKEVTGTSDMYNPAANIKFAAYMSNYGRNWSAWSVKPGF